MEAKYIESAKKIFLNKLILSDKTERAKELFVSDIYSPVFKPENMHPDAEPELDDYNLMIDEIIQDITIMNVEIGTAAYQIRNLMSDTKSQLKDIRRSLAEEKEKLLDISILCNRYADTSAVKKLTDKNFSGDFTSLNNVMSAKVTSSNTIDYEVVSIDGNGYEGNSYVYDGDYIIDTIDTSKREFINDRSNITVYEYSRVTVDNTESEIFPLANIDSIEARCSIVLSSNYEFNMLNINSDSQGLKVISVLTSEDGVKFNEVIGTTLSINDSADKYDTENYIPGSKIICFPDTTYVKLVLESNGYTEETIAFQKSFESNGTIIEKTVTLNSGRRHVIKINDIVAKKNTYQKKCTMISEQLVTDQIKTIALFCNEYVPEYIQDEEALKYILTINGIDYDIVPINSEQNGFKLIRTTEYEFSNDSIIYISEPIKSAVLKVLITAPDTLHTPFVSNLSILTGGE